MTVATAAPECRLIVMTSCENESIGPEFIVDQAAAYDQLRSHFFASGCASTCSPEASENPMNP